MSTNGRYVVYALAEAGLPSLGHFVKLGYASSLRSRLSSLQTGNPRRLSVLALKYFVGRSNVQAAEASLHERFSSRHVHGEWFSVDEELATFLSSVWWHRPMPRPDKATGMFRAAFEEHRELLRVARPELSPAELELEAASAAFQRVGL